MVPLWGCEVDKKCQDVLRFNRPQLPVYPDVRTFPVLSVPCPDVLWMSPPCQDLSVAGKRAGLAGERSGLFYEAIRIALALRDRGLRYVLMEQVPDLLNSNGGEDVRETLTILSDLGFSVAWRVLDSQWFNVPQRRERLFVAVDLRGGRADQILAVAQGLYGGPYPVRAGREAAVASGRDCAPIGFRPESGKLHSCAETYDGMPTLKKTTQCGLVVDGVARYATAIEHERAQGWFDDMTKWGLKTDGTIYEISYTARFGMAGNGVTSNVAEWIGRNLTAVETEPLADTRKERPAP